MPRFTRAILKLSGEVLAGDAGFGYNAAVMESLCCQIADVRREGVEIAVVVGGGNLFRGLPAAGRGMNRTLADHMGMLATVMNGLALEDTFARMGVEVSVMSAWPIPDAVESFDRRRADALLRDGAVVLFTAGTGNPYFSTDTAAALRAVQIGADIILKGTKVDGVYDADPVKIPSARRFDTVTYAEVLARGLKVMDAAAVALCRENAIPIVVFDITTEGTLIAVARGEPVGTIVKEEGNG